MSGKKRWIIGGAAALAAAVLGALALCGVFSPALTLDSPSRMLIQAWDGLDANVIEAELDVESAVITVSQELRLLNRTGQTLEASVLRAWPNAFQTADTSPAAAEDGIYESCYPNGFSAGFLSMKEARVSLDGTDGELAAYRYLDSAKTVLSVPVKEGWPSGEWLTLRLSYTVQVPRMAYRFGVNNGIWALGNCFLVPAIWEDGAFRTDEYAPVGDPFLSDCMNYTVSLSVPQGYVCAGSGWPAVETSGEVSVWRFTSSAVRDFALVVSDRFKMAQAKDNGILITAYATDASKAKEMLEYGRKALACFSSRYGEYPYQSYTLSEIDFPMGGMEYPAMSMIGSAQLLSGGETLENVVAHETAHQWWYAVVGSDQWNQSWQDEALCEFSVLEYLEDVHGLSSRESYEQSHMEAALRVTVPRGVTPGAPLDWFGTMSQYSLVVYDRGAAMLCALDRMLPDGLDPFLRAYYERFAFKRAGREDFETLLAEVTGEDLAPLIRDYLDTYIAN